MGRALLAERRWEELSRIENSFNISHVEDLQWWFWLQVHAWQGCVTVGDKTRAVHFLEQALEASVLGLTHDVLLASAEGVYRLLEDREGAQELLQYVPQPNLRTESSLLSLDYIHFFNVSGSIDSSMHWEISAFQPKIIQTQSAPEQGMVLLRASTLSRSTYLGRGVAWSKLNGRLIKLEVFPLLPSFQSILARDPLDNWPYPKCSRSFTNFLVDAVAQHGPQAS